MRSPPNADWSSSLAKFGCCGAGKDTQRRSGGPSTSTPMVATVTASSSGSFQTCCWRGVGRKMTRTVPSGVVLMVVLRSNAGRLGLGRDSGPRLGFQFLGTPTLEPRRGLQAQRIIVQRDAAGRHRLREVEIDNRRHGHIPIRSDHRSRIVREHERPAPTDRGQR